jgi:hypothetical protein
MAFLREISRGIFSIHLSGIFTYSDQPPDVLIPVG